VSLLAVSSVAAHPSMATVYRIYAIGYETVIVSVWTLMFHAYRA